ncbi:MAG: hypothetical protein JWQ34_2721 [Mucilaginibacter sp.]|uniref:hypothetical protein n=1 Tax=Mucilaginibacter sp. TaxID=1882438 RepID=UPI00262EFDE4|nr:hypothetical protein [Mucilaginibacter sp.]MDB5004496.1 hypothetical protein [Mucilaginibacter sp.]
MNNENQQPLSTQGSANDPEDQLGGTTNLSLEQLKEEDGIASPTDDNPDGLNDQDGLNEIRASDDLDEPDTEDYQPDEQEGDQPDEPTNPAELNS